MWVGAYIQEIGASISSGACEGFGASPSCNLVLATNP